MRIEVGQEISVGARVGAREKRMIQPNFGRERAGRRNPMQGRADPSAIGRIAAAGRRIIGADQLDDVAGGVFHDIAAGDKITVAQPDFPSRRQAVKTLWRALHEVVALHI